MNLLTKTVPWVMASLLTAASAFGQSKCPPAQKTFSQGEELLPNQYMAAYNAPARIDVRGAWDFYANGTFTYWQAIQENMEPGLVNNSTVTTDAVNGDIVNCCFKYKPGFKVGVGMNFDHDNWDGYAQYTWFRGVDTTSTTLDTNNANITIMPMWGHPSTIQADTFFTQSQRWRLHMDLLDLELARSYYVGTCLTFRPFFGARGAWIRQNNNVTYTNTVATSTANTTTISQKSHSWGVGPRAGININWLVGQGFRFYTVGDADILYTRYTKLRSHGSTSIDNVLTTSAQTHVRQNNLSYLRTHLDMELGLGWGTYFDNNNWHVDLFAGYDFQVFFDQNMFRHFNGTNAAMAANSISPNGNLYVQGLNTGVRFDF